MKGEEGRMKGEEGRGRDHQISNCDTQLIVQTS